MKMLRIVPPAIGLAALAFTLAQPTCADVWDKRTDVKFAEPVEFPGGVVLPPGAYVLKLNGSMSNRHIVHVFNENQNRVHATVLAIPEIRMEPADKTIITFHEAQRDEPQLIKSWFYPGDTIGQQFVYPRNRVRQVAGASQSSAPATSLSEREDRTFKPAPISETPPSPESANQNNPQANNDERNQPTLLAQAQPPPEPTPEDPQEPAPRQPATPAQQQPAELAQLPATGSNLPEFALGGVMLLAIASLLRFLRRVSS